MARNSVKQMVSVLKQFGPMTENEITQTAFSYDRNLSYQSNKKYADMLRRGMDKGLIARKEESGLGRARFIYYAVK